MTDSPGTPAQERFFTFQTINFQSQLENAGVRVSIQPHVPD